MTNKPQSDSAEERAKFLETINANNCGEKLQLIRDSLIMTRRDLAKVMGCSEATISRIEAGKTKPTADFMNKLFGLVAIGAAKYKTLSAEERKGLAEHMAALGGAGAGLGASLSAISASGAIAGLSAAGVASGLSVIGGSIAAGAALVASIPVAAGFASFGLVKGIKAICDANKLNCTEIDGRFEIKIIRKNSE
jgi:transcriptional regulator with XRE-family HTH domain